MRAVNHLGRVPGRGERPHSLGHHNSVVDHQLDGGRGYAVGARSCDPDAATQTGGAVARGRDRDGRRRAVENRGRRTGDGIRAVAAVAVECPVLDGAVQERTGGRQKAFRLA